MSLSRDRGENLTWDNDGPSQHRVDRLQCREVVVAIVLAAVVGIWVGQGLVGGGSETRLAPIRPKACAADDVLLAIETLAADGHLRSAEGLIEQALDDSRGTVNHARALRLAAQLRYRLGRLETALTHCWELAALDLSNPEPWRLMARVHQDRGEREQFVEAIWQVIQLDPGDVFDERLRLIDALITLGDRKRAREQYALLKLQAAERLARHPLLEARLLRLEGHPDQARTIAVRTVDRRAGSGAANGQAAAETVNLVRRRGS